MEKVGTPCATLGSQTAFFVSLVRIRPTIFNFLGQKIVFEHEKNTKIFLRRLRRQRGRAFGATPPPGGGGVSGHKVASHSEKTSHSPPGGGVAPRLSNGVTRVHGAGFW